ncbi:hypothetical protein PGB90_002575 [Kerria lacca]
MPAFCCKKPEKWTRFYEMILEIDSQPYNIICLLSATCGILGNAAEILRTYREQNCRQSQTVVDIWDSVLKKSIDKLGDEKYVVWEQVCISSLDCNRIDIANECLLQLSNKFPNSYRVRLLEELLLEYLERYDEALDLLDAMIHDDETNASPRKRKIAILKAKGRNAEAIKELNEYLKKFMIDQDAWNELCDLYLNEQEYAKAAFCMEELILQNPHNHLFHLRFAEIKYTQGGIDNLELALAYYCQALKLSPSNMRALFGLYLSAKYISLSSKLTIWKINEHFIKLYHIISKILLNRTNKKIKFGKHCILNKLYSKFNSLTFNRKIEDI